MKEIIANYTTKDNLKIFTVEWQIENPKGVICFVHGFGEHILRYRHLTDYFGKNGLASLGYDRRGHGQSEGKRGHTPSFETYLEEISQLVITAKEKYPSLPIFLYGHSMGGNLVLNYVLRRHPKVAGVITTGPWIDLPATSKPSALLMTIVNVMNRIWPGLLQPSDLETKYISRDSKEVKKYENDPLVQGKISVRAAKVMTDAAAYLNSFSGKFPLPLLNMHGSADALTDFEASKAFSGRVEGAITFKAWDGWFHEIHNEKDRKEVFDYTLNWMKQVADF